MQTYTALSLRDECVRWNSLQSTREDPLFRRGVLIPPLSLKELLNGIVASRRIWARCRCWLIDGFNGIRFLQREVSNCRLHYLKNMLYLGHPLQNQVDLLKTTNLEGQCFHGLALRASSRLLLGQPGPEIWFGIRRRD